MYHTIIPQNNVQNSPGSPLFSFYTFSSVENDPSPRSLFYGSSQMVGILLGRLSSLHLKMSWWIVVRVPNLYFGSIQHSWGTWLDELPLLFRWALFRWCRSALKLFTKELGNMARQGLARFPNPLPSESENLTRHGQDRSAGCGFDELGVRSCWGSESGTILY